MFYPKSVKNTKIIFLFYLYKIAIINLKNYITVSLCSPTDYTHIYFVQITQAQSNLELEHIIRTVTRERLQLERQVAAVAEVSTAVKICICSLNPRHMQLKGDYYKSFI